MWCCPQIGCGWINGAVYRQGAISRAGPTCHRGSSLTPLPKPFPTGPLPPLPKPFPKISLIGGKNPNLIGGGDHIVPSSYPFPMKDTKTAEVPTMEINATTVEAIIHNIAATARIKPANSASAMPRGRPSIGGDHIPSQAHGKCSSSSRHLHVLGNRINAPFWSPARCLCHQRWDQVTAYVST